MPDGGGNIKIVLIAAHLNAGVILVIGQYSDRYVISLSLSTIRDGDKGRGGGAWRWGKR